MEKIYSSKDIKNSERNYCGLSLMENAAREIITAIQPYLTGKPLTIICGKGNNGGDGWAVASILKNYPVSVIYTDEPKTYECDYYKKAFKGIATKADTEEAFEIIKRSDIILDCIFGSGLENPASGIYEKIFTKINESGAFVISVDVPSGIPSDTGKLYPHVKADVTLCITSRKLSFAVTPTKEAYGKTLLCDIGVSMEHFPPIAKITDDEILNYLPPRVENSNKGTYGTLKTLCGSYDMPGAGVLSINASLRSGVGLIKAFGSEKLLWIYKNRLTEPIFKVFDENYFIEEKASCTLIGCGIGREYDDVLENIILKSQSPLVIDADGINYLSANIHVLEQGTKNGKNIVLTPHPGEMARLIGKSIEFVQENRFEICREFSEKYSCTVVLKGNGTIICSPNQTPLINHTGNSGLSKGGSGDVLSGIIASFIAQGTPPFFASALGVYLHGIAADSLKKQYSEYSLLPSDIPKEIGRYLAERIK